MRVLVTGSQLWEWPTWVHAELETAFANRKPGEPFLVVHGDCPNGADAHALEWVRKKRRQGWSGVVDEEPHSAAWRKNGKLDRSAGFRRNAEMVKLGADLCLAFILNDSNGASHTAGLAKKAGIETKIFTRSTTPMSERPYKRVTDELQLLDVRLMWRNFAGEKRLFNENGKRQFAIPLDEETALHLRDVGWNVRDNQKKIDEGKTDELLYHLDVTVKMDGKVMPRVFMITKKWSEEKQTQVPSRTQLDEDTIGLLDFAEFDNVDLVLRPYNWEMKSTGKKGVSAYLKTMYATLHQDPLDEKYAHIPIEGYDEQLAIEAGDDILDVEAEWVDETELPALPRGAA